MNYKHLKPNVSKFRTVNNLMLQRYERYLPTAFDESMSVLEKMNKIIEFLDTVVKHLNQQSEDIEKWQLDLLEELDTTLDDYLTELNKLKTQYEEFREYIINDLLPESVVNKLDEWLGDGTIAEIINEVIFENINLRIQALENRISSVNVSIKDFGAKGDGVTDDTEAFQLAGLSGVTVNIPEGEYVVTDTVQMVSNTRFNGQGNNSVIKGGDRNILFRADGSYSEPYPLTQDGQIGDHFVNIANTHNFAIGDDVRIMSQRIATSREDSGEDMWLGVATGTSHRVHFGEIKTLSEKSGSRLFFRGGLIFPDYLTHKNRETHPGASNGSVVQKVNFIENIEISGLKIEGDYSNVCRLAICKNAVVKDISWERVENSTMVMFYEGYLCEGRNLTLKYNPSVPSAGVYSRNGLRTVSSMNCGFKECFVEHGTQSIDFTYNTTDPCIPNINSYVEGCTVVGAVNNSMTSHGGSYRCRVINNVMINCHTDGMMVRTRDSQISGNTVTGSGNVETGGQKYGITLYQGSAQNCIVTNNTVSGFTTGIATRSGSESYFRYVGAIITGNNITGCTTAFAFRHGDIPHNARAEILLANNNASNFVGEYGKFLNIYQYVRGLKILDNTFVGNESVNGGVYSRGNSFDFDIRGNVFRGVSRVLWFADVEDSATLGRAPYTISYENNYTFGQLSTEHMGNITLGRKYQYGNLYPYKSESGFLGYSDYRFQALFTVQPPNSLSDLKYKENVLPTNLGLDFVNSLSPVKYNFKNDKDKTVHHGLIAQEIENIFNENNIKDSGIVQKDGEDYGLRYEELIPVLIKAVQELNDKIK